MKDFAQAQKPKANLPFVKFVTRMYNHFKVKGYAFHKITPPDIGAIGKASSSKRSAMTQAEHAMVFGLGSSSARSRGHLFLGLPLMHRSAQYLSASMH